MKKVVNMMLGGQFPKSFPQEGIWCGVDRGALHLVKNGVRPLISCGDFDSINIEDKENVAEKSSRIYVKESQYLTDADFALRKIIEEVSNVEVINIYAATGRRLDHFFGNILLLNNSKYENIEMRIIDDNNIITLGKKGKNTFYPEKGYKYFSVVPIYEDTIMTIKNSKYEAENLVLTLDRPNATSNEFFEDRSIEVEINKNVLIIYSKD